MRDRTILVTGASGLMAAPLVKELARENRVYAVARFTAPAVAHELKMAGAIPIMHDLGRDPVDALPAEVDYVFAAHVFRARRDGSPESYAERRESFEVNTQAVGRLLSRYRRCSGFVQCSTGSLYEYQGQRPLHEEDPYGVHIGVYSFSKIAAEAVVEFAAREWNVPATLIRIFSLYGPAGGAVTQRIENIAAGKPVVLHPDAPNMYNPLYVDDSVSLSIRAMEVASTPPLVVNFAGSEPVSAEDYCRYAAELLGTEARIEYSTGAYWPLWADTTRMHAVLGRSEVSPRDGIRRVIDARYPGRLRRAAGGV